MEEQAEVQATEQEQPNIQSVEDIDSKVADLSDEEILNSTEEEFEAFLNAKEKFTRGNSEDSYEENQVSEEEPAEKTTQEKGTTSEDKTEEESEEEKPAFGTVKIDGEDIPLNSQEDLVQLANLGTKYASLAKKFKPIQKIAKMLEKNDLLSPEKVNYIIDVMKGNKKAISKLMKETKLDPFTDLDLEGSDSYLPNSYNITDQEIAMDEVMEEIREDGAFTETTQAIVNMDASSQAKFFDNPDLVKILNNQIKSGDYDKIQKEIKRLKALDYLPKADDFVTYFNVGKSLYAAGKLSDSPKKSDNSAKQQERKSSASNPKSKGKAPAPTKNDLSQYYDLSDEEILKLDLNKIMR